MLGILTILAQALGVVAKNAFSLAKWAIAQGRLLASHAWLLWSWWLKYSQHSIVLRIAVWTAWTVAIEATAAWLASVTITPLSSGLIRQLMPESGSALLYIMWERGICLKEAFTCLWSYIALYIALQAAVRQAQTTQRLINQRWVDPRVFAK